MSENKTKYPNQSIKHARSKLWTIHKGIQEMNLNREMNFKEKGSLTAYIFLAKICRWRWTPTRWGGGSSPLSPVLSSFPFCSVRRPFAFAQKFRRHSLVLCFLAAAPPFVSFFFVLFSFFNPSAAPYCLALFLQAKPSVFFVFSRSFLLSLPLLCFSLVSAVASPPLFFSFSAFSPEACFSPFFCLPRAPFPLSLCFFLVFFCFSCLHAR